METFEDGKPKGGFVVVSEGHRGCVDESDGGNTGRIQKYILNGPWKSYPDLQSANTLSVVSLA